MAIAQFDARNEDELNFDVGDHIEVLQVLVVQIDSCSNVGQIIMVSDKFLRFFVLDLI